MGCQGDGSVTAELLPRFAVFVDGETMPCFHPAGIVPPSQHLWKKSSRIFRNDSGASFSIRYETVSTPVETLTFLMEAKARLSSVQVSGVLTARLSSGTGCVKVASITRRNCCLSAGRLSVSLASAKAFARASALLCCRVAGQNQEQRTVASFF